MPALMHEPVDARVVWLGSVPDRDRSLASGGRNELRLGYGGPDGEAHAGLTRPSCSRVTALYPRDTVIRNVRQLTIVSAEDLAAIASDMGIDAVDPAWLGATMVVKGIPDFTHIPPSSRLQASGGATVTVDMENRPCHLPAAVIDAARPGMGRRFKSAAAGRRGVTAWVEREGIVEVGARIRLFVPAQRTWRGPSSAEREPGGHGEEEAGNEAGVDEEAGGGHRVAPAV